MAELINRLVFAFTVSFICVGGLVLLCGVFIASTLVLIEYGGLHPFVAIVGQCMACLFVGVFVSAFREARSR